MKDITFDACRAFMAAQPFKRSNTEVVVLPNVTVLMLFGNSIAYRYNDPEKTLSVTNCGWKTATTKERLNGIEGVRIHQRKGGWFLNDVKWNGELIDVK
jgi:pyruvate carboxylase